MATGSDLHRLTPLQRAIHDVDQLDLPPREAMRLVTQRVGYFVGQQRYDEEQTKIAAVLADVGSASG